MLVSEALAMNRKAKRCTQSQTHTQLKRKEPSVSRSFSIYFATCTDCQFLLYILIQFLHWLLLGCKEGPTAHASLNLLPQIYIIADFHGCALTPELQFPQLLLFFFLELPFSKILHPFFFLLIFSSTTSIACIFPSSLNQPWWCLCKKRRTLYDTKECRLLFSPHLQPFLTWRISLH